MESPCRGDSGILWGEVLGESLCLMVCGAGELCDVALFSSFVLFRMIAYCKSCEV